MRGTQAFGDPGTRWGHNLVMLVLAKNNSSTKGKNMRIENVASVVTLDEIDWGQAFQFRFRDKNYIGIKTFIAVGSDRLPMVAVIWPSHPNRPDEPGIFEPAVLRGKALVALVDAAFVLSSKLDDTRLDDSATGAAGGILFSPGHAPVMSVRAGEGMKYLDLESSELLDQPKGRISAQVAKWSLVRKILGEFESIAEFKVAT